MELTEKTLNSKVMFEGRILKMMVDDVELPDGSTSFREIVGHPGGVCIAPIDDDNNLYFVKQYRYPYHEIVLELPAGKLEKGMSPLDNGKRELKEEVGAEGDEFNPIYHNAVSQIEDESLGENVIAQVYQKGYKIGEKVVRCAMVVVANP